MKRLLSVLLLISISLAGLSQTNSTPKEIGKKKPAEKDTTVQEPIKSAAVPGLTDSTLLIMANDFAMFQEVLGEEQTLPNTAGYPADRKKTFSTSEQKLIIWLLKKTVLEPAVARYSRLHPAKEEKPK